jgi:hypothetical protein
LIDAMRAEACGRRPGPALSEAEHYFKCEACGGFFDMSDLAQVYDHEGPLPHPACDQVQ